MKLLRDRGLPDTVPPLTCGRYTLWHGRARVPGERARQRAPAPALLAGHTTGTLDDPAGPDVALKRFAEERDQPLMESYQATPPVAQANARDRRRAVGTRPEPISRCFNTAAGIRPVSELYTPGHTRGQ